MWVSLYLSNKTSIQGSLSSESPSSWSYPAIYFDHLSNVFNYFNQLSTAFTIYTFIHHLKAKSLCQSLSASISFAFITLSIHSFITLFITWQILEGRNNCWCQPPLPHCPLPSGLRATDFWSTFCSQSMSKWQKSSVFQIWVRSHPALVRLGLCLLLSDSFPSHSSGSVTRYSKQKT